MGWNNPPIPWREFERRLSWRTAEPGEPGKPGEPSEPSESVRPPEPAKAAAPPEPGPREIPAEPAEPAEQAGPARPVQPWVELHCHSSYSFLDGASDPAELVAEAERLGVEALALTDHDGMYGVVRFAQATQAA